MKITCIGDGSQKIAIIGLLHGNEPLGLRVIKKLENFFFNFKIVLIVANTEAAKINKRYVDTDLNRCFPGNKSGTHEEKIAVEILEKIADCDYVIDIHSTTAITEGFIINTSSEKCVDRLIVAVPLKKIITMHNSIANSKSLIDNVRCGISLEFNKNENISKVTKIVIDTIKNLEKNIPNPGIIEKEHFEVYGILKKQDDVITELKNFVETELDGEKFYPVLCGEKEYGEILCLKARKMIRNT